MSGRCLAGPVEVWCPSAGCPSRPRRFEITHPNTGRLRVNIMAKRHRYTMFVSGSALGMLMMLMILMMLRILLILLILL